MISNKYQNLKKDIDNFFNTVKEENFNYATFCNQSNKTIDNTHVCGTTFCLAGHLYAKDMIEKNNFVNTNSVIFKSLDYCCDKYGLSANQANLLFTPCYLLIGKTTDVEFISPDDDVSLTDFREFVNSLFDNEDFINDTFE